MSKVNYYLPLGSMEIKLLIENKFNEGYLRKVFKANKTGPITISRTSDIGKFICSMVKYVELPPKQTVGILLILPDTSTSTGDHKFCTFTIEDQSKINDYISATFRIWFDRVLVEGIHKLNLDRRTITDVIISELSIEKNSENEQKIFERIRKYEYRSREKALKSLIQSLECYEYK